jgi:hypothetical protein
MSGDLRLWSIVMLAAGSLFTAGLIWYAWERVRIWRRLDLHAFAVSVADPAAGRIRPCTSSTSGTTTSSAMRRHELSGGDLSRLATC